ncbi:integral membrane protein [Colletotrichum tofieldiae]|uniref:Integral membrane protein n=1 Tax=Colletotrichum tofieldiae TaxID=708197 RepID=A0A166YH64_9PEZI|nr:integral membrane protein [Colletotrichum tofieldiae]
MSDQDGAAPPPDNVVPNLQHPEDVLHSINLVSQILAITLLSLFMVLRLYTKTFIAPPFHTDDLGHFGGGFHVYEISKESFKGVREVLTSSLGVYAITLVYSPSSYFTKLTLLWITIRVFRLHRKTIIGTYAVIFFLTCYTIPVLFIKALICRPIAGFWDPAIQTTCYNQRAIFVADTAVSAITDMAVLCIPIPVAATLRMSWNKRLKVIAMLSSGGVATAASIIRLVLVIKLQNSHDEPIDLIRFNLLGTAEVSIGLMCACLPAINILFLNGFASLDSSRNTIGSSRIMELKFLKGSKLKTQRITTAEVAAAVATQEPIQTEEGRNSYILPFERVARAPLPTMQNLERGELEDEWYAQVVASPFSEPGAPDWAREAVE